MATHPLNRFGLLIALAGALTGCSKPQAPVLIPLTAGNTWDYVKRVTDADGNTTEEKANAAVKGTRVIDEYTWVQYEELGDEYWLRNAPNGQWEAPLNDEDPAQPIAGQGTHFFRFPVEGQSTVAPYQPYADGELQVSLLSSTEEVTVPAGTFTCYHYQISDEWSKTDQFLAPGVGLVKATWRFTEGGSEEAVLTAYKLVD